MQETLETRVWSLSKEAPLEKGLAIYSWVFPWKNPWTEVPHSSPVGEESCPLQRAGRQRGFDRETQQGQLCSDSSGRVQVTSWLRPASSRGRCAAPRKPWPVIEEPILVFLWLLNNLIFLKVSTNWDNMSVDPVYSVLWSVLHLLFEYARQEAASYHPPPWQSFHLQ